MEELNAVGDLPGETPSWCNQLCLPSSNSVYAVVSGDTKAIPVLLLHYAARSTIIGIGLAAAGIRGKQLLLGSIAAAGAFEASLLTWALWKRREENEGT